MVVPGRSVPSASAASIIERATRSFTEPPGFWPSSLARMRTAGLGLSTLTSTTGVLPMQSITEAWTGMAGCRQLLTELVGILPAGVQDLMRTCSSLIIPARMR